MHARKIHVGVFAWLVLVTGCLAQSPDASNQGSAAYGGAILPSQQRRVIAPVLDYRTLDAIINEMSGDLTMQHVQVLTLYHRTQPSIEYKRAAEYVLEKLKESGLSDARMESYPADGKTMYSTLRARPQWDADFAELWLRTPYRERLGSYAETALAVARYSRSAKFTAELVDVGLGTSDSDYTGKNVAGKIVLAEGDTNVVHRKAVYEKGALGVIDYRLNLIPTSRQQDLLDLVTQGLLWPFDPEFNSKATFAFMITPRRGRELRALVQEGQKVTVDGEIRARVGPGEYQITTATIPGRERADQEFVLSCHLSHPRPGANDNVSGCAAILEVARALSRSIATGTLPRPRRPIRFIFPPENAGTVIYQVSHPEAKLHQVAAMQLDGVGGNPFITGSILHLYRTPYSMATYLNDVAQNLFQFVSDVNIEKIPYRVNYPHQFQPRIVAPSGTRDNFWGTVDEFFDGSDSFIYSDSSIGVPAVYLEDWPDPYLHTNGDRPEHLDPTKLQRSCVIAGAIAYTVANASDADVIRFGAETANRARERVANLERDAYDQMYLCAAGQRADCYARMQVAIQQAYRREALAIVSPMRLAPGQQVNATLTTMRDDFLSGQPASERRLAEYYRWATGSRMLGAKPLTHEETEASRRFPVRNKKLIGPMDSFFFDYLTVKMGPEYRKRYEIFNLPVNAYAFESAYEALNFADGTRSVLEIAHALEAEFGDVPLHAVDQYMQALAESGVIEWRTAAAEKLH
jgi:aminopeptidase YwaD